jgi:hypothetical protein
MSGGATGSLQNPEVLEPVKRKAKRATLKGPPPKLPYRSGLQPDDIGYSKRDAARTEHTKDVRAKTTIYSSKVDYAKKAQDRLDLESDKREERHAKREASYIGIDGEGMEINGVHKYILLAWSSADGSKKDYIENVHGLSTVECLNFILDIPKGLRPFAFAFNYDISMMLSDVHSEALYLLFRPELRKGKFGPRPLLWNGFLLNLQGTKLTISRAPYKGEKKKKVPVVSVWDIFKFFQSKFTKALEGWGVGTAKEIEEMERMKNLRGDFKNVDYDSIRRYCFDECEKMAQLASTLVEAHEEAGLPLKTFYGAGSTASLMLKAWGIGDLSRNTPEPMQDAVGRAFFGGRFEHSCIGHIPGPVYGYDISSAYPYQTYFLPCLEHGEWTLTKDVKKARAARAACVHYAYSKPIHEDEAWAPFPFRDEKGSIIYPRMSGGGWVWRDEFFAGADLFPEVEFVEAWIYTCKCRCKPFGEIASHYMQRLKWGKEGKGIVLKLGVNSVYGKLAQSIGDDPPFQCWIWAGIITSGTRAQILQLLALHKDRKNMLAVATDGVYTRERLVATVPDEKNPWTEKALKKAAKIPDPVSTKMESWVKKPLGGWEEKTYVNGLFFMRPGIYFPLTGTEKEMLETRARGIGKATMRESIRRMVDAWNSFGTSDAVCNKLDCKLVDPDTKKNKGRNLHHVHLPNIVRFHGAKTCLTKGVKSGIITRSPLYGQWRSREIVLRFDPLPKRDQVLDDRCTLPLRHMEDGMSAIYKKSLLSEEARQAKLQQQESEEQPQGEFDNYFDMNLEAFVEANR